MNHLTLFGQSFSILWRNKALWAFGLLAALGGGGLASLLSIVNFNTVQPMAHLPLDIPPQTLGTWLGINAAQMIAASLALGAFAYLLHTLAESALISMVNSFGAGQPMGIGGGLQAGARRFLPLLAVRVVLILPIVLLGALVAGSFVSMIFGTFGEPQAKQQFLFNFGTMFGLIILINLINILSMGISVSAKRAIVLEDISIRAAIAQGWILMRRKSGDYLMITILLLLIGFLINSLTFVITAPALFSGFTSNVVQETSILLLISNLVIGTVTSIFISSVWTLAYRKWQSRTAIITPTSTSA